MYTKIWFIHSFIIQCDDMFVKYVENLPPVDEKVKIGPLTHFKN